MIPADHPLTAPEIRERFGALIDAGFEAFREDIGYLEEIALAAVAMRQRVARRPVAPSAPRGPSPEQTAREARAVELFDEGLSGEKAAAALGMSPAGVKFLWRRVGLDPAARRAQVLADRRSAIVALRAEGLTRRESADRLGEPYVFVSKVWRETPQT